MPTPARLSIQRSSSGPRRRHGWSACLLLLVATATTALTATDSSPEQRLGVVYEQEVRPLLDTYCVSCHGRDKQKGDVSFAPYQRGPSAIGARRLWHQALGEISKRNMPPEKERQPTDAERKRLVDWMKALRRLDGPDPGDAVIRRLSRVEYDNTVRDLFGVDLQAGRSLPEDSPGEAFDNSLSPLLMEKYLVAADEVLDRLIMPEQFQRHLQAGQLDAVVAGVADPGKADGKERRFAAAGEVSALLDVPVQGTYTVRIRAGADQAGNEPARLGVRFDNQVVSELKITARAKSPAPYTVTVKLAAGRTRFSVVFMNPFVAEPPAAPAPAKPDPGAKPKPPVTTAGRKPDPAKDAKDAKDKAAAEQAVRAVTIDSIELIGPPAKPPTEVQRRLFIAAPGQEPGPEASKEANKETGKEQAKQPSRQDAARAIIAPFAYRAFRRQPYREEIDGLLAVFALADAQDQGFSDAVKLMMKAVLVSPQFLYRTPEDTAGRSAANGVVPVGDHELATRLSYFLWATMPDEELLQLARDGRLHEPTVLAAQTRRLIADPRSRALVETFMASWLGLNDFASVVVDEKKFPQMTPALRAAMYEEVMTFTEHLMRDGGSILDLIDCEYGWLTAQTAKIYGVESVTGAKPQRVSLSDRNRGGLLGMPAILMATSRADRTSPVKRGKWVLETLFDAAPPPPPPNVDGLDKQNTPANAELTLRQKTERHRTDPACASCHRVMDPLGFGLENFDAIGRWRERDENGGRVDAQGELPGKQRFGSPLELKRILMARKDEFVRVFTAKMLGFALGRRLAGYDEVVVDDLAEGVARDHSQLDALIVGIVTSYPFTHRRALR